MSSLRLVMTHLKTTRGITTNSVTSITITTSRRMMEVWWDGRDVIMDFPQRSIDIDICAIARRTGTFLLVVFSEGKLSDANPDCKRIKSIYLYRMSQQEQQLWVSLLIRKIHSSGQEQALI
jgi:hypothetical protein